MGVRKLQETPGDGKTFPQENDDVEMHYVGYLVDYKTEKVAVNGVPTMVKTIVREADGKPKKTVVFDSSRTRNALFKTKIGIGKVIRGWDEGVPQMSLGEKCSLEITPDFGYGERGFPNVIPENSDLYFEVELLAIHHDGKIFKAPGYPAVKPTGAI